MLRRDENAKMEHSCNFELSVLMEDHTEKVTSQLRVVKEEGWWERTQNTPDRSNSEVLRPGGRRRLMVFEE